MKISVILSTCNRIKSLSQTLDSFCQQDIDESFDYEIIVVDNNSKDQTKEIIDSFIKRNSKIRYVFEPKQGVSNARNSGIENAKGEILAFIDDDVLLDKYWLWNIAQFCSEYDFDAIGGRVLPIYPPNTPKWIKECRDILAGPIVCHDYGETIKLYDRKMSTFIGANMIIKQEIFHELGDFNPDMGGGKGTMGEDTEIFRRIGKLGKKIYYNPNILIMHPVEKQRMNLFYIAKWHIASGRFLVLEDSKEEMKLICYFGIPRYLFRKIIKSFFYLILSLTNVRKFIQSWNNFFTIIGMIKGYSILNHKKELNYDHAGHVSDNS